MNVFIHELRAYRRSTITWAFSLVAVVVFLLSWYPAFAKEIDSLVRLIESLPKPVRAALGISAETFDTLLGYYSFIFMYVMLCGSVQAMSLGVSLMAREMMDKTADFLLTKPITRTSIMTSKLMAGLSSLAVTNAVYLAAASAMAALVSTKAYSVTSFLMISLTLLFTQLMFFALGVLVSVIMPQVKSVLPISLGTVFAFFIIGLFSSTIGDRVLRYLTPFEYFDPRYIIETSSYEMPFPLIAGAFVTVAILTSYVVFVRKDIHAV